MRRRDTQPVDRDQLQRELLLRPPKKTFVQKIRDFIWDPKEKTCLTRSPINWIAICTYYTIFLAGVMLIFILSMLTAYYISSQNHNRPQYILQDSPIGSTPTLNYFPLSKSKLPLIWVSDRHPYTDYVNSITETFNQYKAKNNSFNPSEFGSCANAPFGYDKKTPCLFFRLNRLILWKPKPYKKGDKLPSKMPDSVKNLIENSDSPKIWINCQGSTAKDRDHISPDFFQLQGTKGIDPSPFPFDSQEHFLDPIVALQLNDPKPRKVLYSFTCYAWAKEMEVEKTYVDVNYYIE